MTPIAECASFLLTSRERGKQTPASAVRDMRKSYGEHPTGTS